MTIKEEIQLIEADAKRIHRIGLEIIEDFKDVKKIAEEA